MRNLRALLPVHIRVHVQPKGPVDKCPLPEEPTCDTVRQVSARLDESEGRLQFIESQLLNLRHLPPNRTPKDTE
jgi:hypothetical protein